jgi:hypothetical protein
VKEPKHQPAWVPADGAPDAAAHDEDVRLEMWMPMARIETGDWAAVHVRVSNIGTKAVVANCAPTTTRADFSGLLERGLTWPGVAGQFKEKLLDEQPLVMRAFRYRTGEGIDCPGGDIGQWDRLRPGDAWDIDLYLLPSYYIDNQAYPSGSVTVTTQLQYGRSFNDELSSVIQVQADFELQGRPFPGASPQILADRVLQTSGFLEWLDGTDPTYWVNTHIVLAAFSKKINWPLFHFDGPAPNGTITIGLFADSSNAGLGFGQVLLDPWTGDSFGFLLR